MLLIFEHFSAVYCQVYMLWSGGRQGQEAAVLWRKLWGEPVDCGGRHEGGAVGCGGMQEEGAVGCGGTQGGKAPSIF